ILLYALYKIKFGQLATYNNLLMKLVLSFLIALFLVGSTIDTAREANEAYRKGNYEKAISLYKKAIDKTPENAKLYYNLGNALAKSGSAEEAIRYFNRYKQMVDRLIAISFYFMRYIKSNSGNL